MSHRSPIAPGVLAGIVVMSLVLGRTSLHAQPAGDFVPVTDAMLQDPAPDDWLMWRRTLDGWGYSPLDQITPENVGDLRMVWTRTLTDGSQTGTPLAYEGVLYMPNPDVSNTIFVTAKVLEKNMPITWVIPVLGSTARVQCLLSILAEGQKHGSNHAVSVQ